MTRSITFQRLVEGMREVWMGGGKEGGVVGRKEGGRDGWRKEVAAVKLI